MLYKSQMPRITNLLYLVFDLKNNDLLLFLKQDEGPGQEFGEKDLIYGKGRTGLWAKTDSKSKVTGIFQEKGGRRI